MTPMSATFLPTMDLNGIRVTTCDMMEMIKSPLLVVIDVEPTDLLLDTDPPLAIQVMSRKIGSEAMHFL